MFRFINSQVFKPTGIQHHRPGTGVDHVWRSISTTPKRSAGGPKRAITGPKSGPPRTRTKSQTPPQQTADVTQDRSKESGNHDSGSNAQPMQPEAEEGIQGQNEQTTGKMIQPVARHVDTMTGELRDAIIKCNRKVDTKCRNITRKMDTDREVAREMTTRLRDFLGCLLSTHCSGPPARGATKLMSPTTTGSSSSTSGDSKQ